jgi:hypothetical protein
MDDLLGRFASEDLVNLQTGEIYAEAGDELTEEVLAAIEEAGLDALNVLDIDNINVGGYMRATWLPIRTTPATRLWWTSTGSCARASRRRRKPLKPCSTACSLIPSAMTCPRWAG